MTQQEKINCKKYFVVFKDEKCYSHECYKNTTQRARHRLQRRGCENYKKITKEWTGQEDQ